MQESNIHEIKTVKAAKFVIQQLKPKCEILPFPIEKSDNGAVPNDIIRSSIFGLKEVSSKEFLQEKVIGSCKDLRVTYTGKELNQSDLDVWIAVKKSFIRDENCDQNIVFQSKDILKTLNKTYGTNDKKWLRSKLVGMSASVIVIENLKKGSGCAFSLIKNLEWLDDYNTFRLSLDPKILELFKKDSFSYLDLENRKLLKTDLAKWLYNYYRSHKTPFPVYDTSIHEWCGSKMKNKIEFRNRLKKSLKELQEIQFLKEFIVSRDGLVTVQIT